MFTINSPFPRRSFLQGVGAAVAVSAFGKTSNEPNSQSNPYHVVVNWAHLPDSIQWGQAVAMDIDKDGNIYVFHRADPGVLKFSPEGTLLKSWGTGMFVQAHGLLVDRFGFIRTADSDAKDGNGGQVFKFDADGKVLMELGKKGVLAESPTGETFVGPTGIAVAANGDIFVSDGHAPAQHGNHRILKFSKDGKFIKAWGSKSGSAQGEVRDPHGIAMDSKGRLLVADRGNTRIQVFDPEGNFVAEWPQFGHCANIYIAKGDVLYVTDSNSSATGRRGGPGSPFKRGIRVGSAKDGSVKYFIPEESYDPSQRGTSGPVGLCADSKGTVYACDVGTTVGFDKMMKKYVKT